MTTPSETCSVVDQLMEQAQVFASAWSLVGGRFDNGGGLAHAEAMKAELRAMLVAAIANTEKQTGGLLGERPQGHH